MLITKVFMKDIEEFDDYLVDLRTKSTSRRLVKNGEKSLLYQCIQCIHSKIHHHKIPGKITKGTSSSRGKDIWHFRMVQVGPQKYTLDYVENQILRKMGDPRIHFAINCGAKSCPILLNEAYLPEKLNGQLTKMTKKFVQNTSHNTIKPKKVEISKIFEWYAEDFNKNGETIISFLNKYGTVTVEKGAKISYKEYNWTLNE